MPLTYKEIIRVAMRNDRIKTLNITWFYRICKIYNILNEVFESWFHLVLEFE